MRFIVKLKRPLAVHASFRGEYEHAPPRVAYLRAPLRVAANLALASICACGSSFAAELDGWQGMRVIKQEGAPQRMLAADLAGEGRKQVIVVNTRLSRLDFYRWLPVDQRVGSVAADIDRPNELPLAPEWRHSELGLDELPVDLIVQDLDADGRPELVILTAPSNKVLVYRQDDARQWKKSTHWELLAGAPVGKPEVMLLRPLKGDKFELLVSCEQGIQALPMEPGGRPAWLSPREGRGRLKFKLLDLDGDGDLDLLEWSQQARQTIRWYECRDEKLLPAQVLYDQSASGVDTIAVRGQPAELLLLGGTQEGLLRRYALARGEENELGRQESLPMPGGAKAAWCGLMLGEQPAIAAVDPAQPRLRVQGLDKTGWLSEQSYPIISGTRALAALHAQKGTLLLWVKDSADLYETHWEAGRMTYPKVMPRSAEVQDRGIVALGNVGTTTWWAQRVGADLDLYVWEVSQGEPQRHRLAGLGTSSEKVEKVVWLGGPRVLFQRGYSGGCKIASVNDGKVKITEPAHLAKVDLAEFGLFGAGGPPRLGRMTDGVLQWLNDDLQPSDQVMLSEGQRIASFVPLAGGDALALEQGGAFIHHLKPDTAGVLRVVKTIKPPNGLALTSDPVLGLVLVDQDRIVRLSPGRPWELTLRDSLDGRVGRPSGVKEATIHRILSTDVAGHGQDEVVLCDDKRHQLTVLGRTDQGLKPLSSWTVFEDRTYPYGGQEGAQVPEPRTVVGLDADGDSRQDLALLCQDRLLIYIARETK